MTEGIDNDGDGRINEDGPGGVDLDRNFPHGWDPRRPDSGRSCPSEPESRALIEHVLNNPQIAAVLVYGHEEAFVGVPPANTAADREPPTGPHPEDLPWIEQLSSRFREIVADQRPIASQATGSFRQWAYYQHGLPAFSTPLWCMPAAEGDEGKTPDALFLEFADREGSGFHDWLPFEHPTLGAVEIGGFAPLFRIDPPPRLVPEIVGRQVRAVTEILSRLPRLKLDPERPKQVSPGVYEVKLTVRNEGAIPAVTAMGRKTRAPLPPRLELDLPPERILQGKARHQVERLDAGKAVELRWLLRGSPGEKVRIRLVSARCGAAEVEVTL
jgi:hypothetical protein